jgi:looped-hinge helix DNA binding domain, AbrB family
LVEEMERVVIKRADSQGRIVLPKEWRDRFDTDEFVLVLKEDRIEIYPKVSSLSRLVDSVEMEELPSDWNELKRSCLSLHWPRS